MVDITSIRGATVGEVDNALRNALTRAGFQYTSKIKTSTSMTYGLKNNPQIRGYRRNQQHGTTGRRGRHLGWDDWVEANNLVNKVLDQMRVSANVKSLGGKFRIRVGKQGMKDWSDQEYENVGSVVYPVARRDQWRKD